VRFQPPLGGTLHLSRTNAFFLGGGKALMNAYYHSAEQLGIDIHYEAQVTDLEIEGDQFKSATFTYKGSTHQVRAKAVVIACGGFQANLEWLEEAWGPAAKNFLVRGTPYNRGDILKVLLAKGAKQISDPLQGHCVAIDARSPKYDGGIITRVDAVSLGIVVNKNAQRFYDEGEDFWPKRYAIWGRLVAGQPDQIGYSIVDAKAMGKFMPPVYPPIRANTLRELATIVRRIGTGLIREGFFADESDISTFAQDLDALDRDPDCKRLSWRHGIGRNVLDKKLRVSEVANWMEYQVLPMRVKRGRG
jgi:tricarballylate dehydrogenase